MKEQAGTQDSVRDKAGAALQGAQKRVSKAYDRTAKVATQWGRDAVGYGRDNPLTTSLVTSLVAFGAGVGLGCWLGYERRSRRSKRFIPAMAGAVAHAVREAIAARR